MKIRRKGCQRLILVILSFHSNKIDAVLFFFGAGDIMSFVMEVAVDRCGG